MRKEDCRRGRAIAFASSRFVASRDGAAAGEFVLVLPIFLLCLFGITSFASTLYMENNMVNAAREAVREMAVTEAPFSQGAVTCGSEEAAVVGSAARSSRSSVTSANARC